MKLFASILAAATLAVAFTLPAAAESFGVTNTLTTSGAAITGIPTNSPTTNGFNQMTGRPISIANQAQVGFYMSGNLSASNAIVNTNKITVTLIRSMQDSPPTPSTNGVIWTADGGWDLSNTLSITFTWATNFNRQTFTTNLGEAYIYGWNWIGVYDATNLGLLGIVTNFDCGLNKKVLPAKLSL